MNHDGRMGRRPTTYQSLPPEEGTATRAYLQLRWGEGERVVECQSPCTGVTTTRLDANAQQTQVQGKQFFTLHSEGKDGGCLAVDTAHSPWAPTAVLQAGVAKLVYTTLILRRLLTHIFKDPNNR